MKKEKSKKRGHSRVFLSGISLFGVVHQIRKQFSYLTKTEKVGVPRTLRAATSGMTALFNSLIRAFPTFSLRGRRNKAFTLIELLVVVLIIGILAAIALPQYQKAVDKARMTQLITFAYAVEQAQQRYYLANGTYADNWADLDIGLSGYMAAGRRLGKGDPYNVKDPYAVLNYQNNGLYFYGGTDYLPGILLIAHNTTNYWLCYADKTNDRAQTLCKNVCLRTTLGTDGSWRTCFFSRK